MEVLKISSKSNPNSVAGAIAGLVKESTRAEMQAIGAGALNQAIKAVAIARGYIAPTGKEIPIRQGSVIVMKKKVLQIMMAVAVMVLMLSLTAFAGEGITDKTEQRYEAAVAHLNELYIKKYPEGALTVYHGSYKDKKTLENAAKKITKGAKTDEEKAKKLAEDLDLLDGLKLSVQHCQEVMDKNEERYPLLEKIFNLLSAQNEEIKADIKELQDALAKLQDVPTDSDSDAE